MTMTQIKHWFLAARPETFTASSIPVLLGAVWAFYQQVSADWWLLVLIWPAATAVQAGTNLVGEYFDHCKGNITLGSSRMLVEGILPPRWFLWAGLGMFAVTAGLGLIFVALRGVPILIIGGIGILGGLFYTAAPVGYKYHGMGDIMVFILMGPLMVIGSFFVLTATYSHDVLLVSLPVGFLVTAILSGNNLRDMLPDRKCGFATTAGVLGYKWARIEYAGLIGSAYAVTVVLVAVRVLPAWSLITFLSVPLAYRCLQMAFEAEPDRPEQLAVLDMRAAQLHLIFGVFLVLSLGIAAMVN